MESGRTGDQGKEVHRLIDVLNISAGGRRSRRGLDVARGTIELALAASLMLVTARLVGVVVAPSFGAEPPAIGQVEQPRFDTDLTVLTRIDPFASLPSSVVVASAEIPITLYGVRIENGGQGSAIIGLEGGGQFAFAVNDEIVSGIRLRSISADHVALDVNGRARILEMNEARSSSPPVSRVSRSAAVPAPESSTQDQRPSAIEIDAGRLIAEAGLQPRIREGQLTGYAVSPHAAGEALQRAGLAPGDVVVALNGDRVTPDTFVRLAQETATSGHFQLTVERGSATRTITLQAFAP